MVADHRPSHILTLILAWLLTRSGKVSVHNPFQYLQRNDAGIQHKVMVDADGKAAAKRTAHAFTQFHQLQLPGQGGTAVGSGDFVDQR